MGFEKRRKGKQRFGGVGFHDESACGKCLMGSRFKVQNSVKSYVLKAFAKLRSCHYSPFCIFSTRASGA